MRRLNVREAQIDECIAKSMFAISARPRSPELQPGELLLLQLVKTDADRMGKKDSRVDFALVFDHLEADQDGTESRKHWPTEGRVWPWIVHCSATVPTVPFSLENLGLTRAYAGQVNPMLIVPSDEQKIAPLIQWSLSSVPKPQLQLVAPGEAQVSSASSACSQRSSTMTKSQA